MRIRWMRNGVLGHQACKVVSSLTKMEHVDDAWW